MASVSALAHLPTLQNLGPFQVIEGIPNIEALTHFLWLGIGGFRLKLGLRSNTTHMGQGCIGGRVGWNIFFSVLSYSKVKRCP